MALYISLHLDTCMYTSLCLLPIKPGIQRTLCLPTQPADWVTCGYHNQPIPHIESMGVTWHSYSQLQGPQTCIYSIRMPPSPFPLSSVFSIREVIYWRLGVCELTHTRCFKQSLLSRGWYFNTAPSSTPVYLNPPE